MSQFIWQYVICQYGLIAWAESFFNDSKFAIDYVVSLNVQNNRISDIQKYIFTLQRMNCFYVGTVKLQQVTMNGQIQLAKKATKIVQTFNNPIT